MRQFCQSGLLASQKPDVAAKIGANFLEQPGRID